MQPVRTHKLLIGISPRILHQVPAQLGFHDKTLQYLEQSVAHWVMALGAMPVMLPTLQRDSLIRPSRIQVADYVDALDGLILQGGTDVDPSLYGEDSVHSQPPFDPLRDRFELALLRGFADAGKPVFGICRGMQLINVAYGGSLYQDLLKDQVTDDSHVQSALYDQHTHAMHWPAHGWFASLYPGLQEGQVNSIHHQAIKTLGTGLVAEAWSDDGVIEMMRGTGGNWLVGAQWHPEFHDGSNPALLPADPLMRSFLQAAERARAGALDDQDVITRFCKDADSPHLSEENHHA